MPSSFFSVTFALARGPKALEPALRRLVGMEFEPALKRSVGMELELEGGDGGDANPE